MGKRHMRHHDEAFDDSLLSGGFDDVDYDALFEATDRRISRQKRRHRKAVRNRFDDYDEERWLSRHINDWDDADFDDDLSFDDDDWDR